MRFKKVLRKSFFCLGLAFGGAAMRPEEIEELMHAMNRPTIAHSLREDRETGDNLVRALLRKPSNPPG